MLSVWRHLLGVLAYYMIDLACCRSSATTYSPAMLRTLRATFPMAAKTGLAATICKVTLAIEVETVSLSRSGERRSFSLSDVPNGHRYHPASRVGPDIMTSIALCKP